MGERANQVADSVAPAPRTLVKDPKDLQRGDFTWDPAKGEAHAAGHDVMPTPDGYLLFDANGKTVAHYDSTNGWMTVRNHELHEKANVGFTPDPAWTTAPKPASPATSYDDDD